MKKYFPLILLGLVLLSSCNSPASSNTSEDSAPLQEQAGAVEQELPNDDLVSSNFSEEEDEKLPQMKPEATLNQLRKSREKAKKAELAFFESPRLKGWVANLTTSEDEDGMPEYETLDQAKFESLDARELTYYYLAHPDEWDQVCAETIVEGGDVQAIMVHIPFDMSGDYASERQSNAIKRNIEEVEPLVLECIRANENISIDMLRFIADFKLVSAVPVLVEKYKQQSEPKDDLILSCLMEMMSGAKFVAWTSSELYKKAGEAYYETLELSPVVADKILFYAQKFGKESLSE